MPAPKKGPRLAGGPAHQRQLLANLAGAFSVRRPVTAEKVVLIDDVFTTGATARAASAALLEHGARSVHVLTLARAVGWE